MFLGFNCFVFQSTAPLCLFFKQKTVYGMRISDWSLDVCSADLMALAWHPPADAFDHYPNHRAVCTIGAGADNVLACPSLRPDIHVVRVVDPAQADRKSVV